jgi:cyanuric acid amidohydrolase
MKARVHRLSAAAPDDTGELQQLIDEEQIIPQNIVAILGKTEGNGCVNDFTRAFATQSFRQLLAAQLNLSLHEIEQRIALVMSGGTEGGLSPHWLVFEVDKTPAGNKPAAGKTLAIGTAFTDVFAPQDIGRMAQIEATAAAVRRAMQQAQLTDPADVHYVQIKCPLLTGPRIAAAAVRGHSVATRDTYASMGYSRGASALGVALALGEVESAALSDAAVCNDYGLFSSRASTSAGIELMRSEIMVLGNSSAWSSDYVIGHAVMRDAIDVEAADRALVSIMETSGRLFAADDRRLIAAVLAKAEAARDGRIRGDRHIMLDDSDIHASRHARAFVGGVLAGKFGDTRLFVSGGAEHQGPDGGGPLALIISTASKAD